MQFEIRPHHTFKGWFIIWRDGQSCGAFANKADAEAYVQRQKRIDDLKKREIRL